MKKLNLSILLFMLMVCNVFAQSKQQVTTPIETNAIANKPIVTMITGPAGNQIPAQTAPVVNPTLSCIVSGVNISVSGSQNFTYFTSPDFCIPNGSFLGTGSWTGNYTTSPAIGFVTYTFSEPIISARIGYVQVNWNDVGTMSINGTSPIQLSDPCHLTIAGNVVSGDYSTSEHGNVGITVSSATPFTTITITNSGGQSGWGSSNPCNFTLTLPPSPTIVNCPKIAMGEMCYRASGPQHVTPFSVFNSSTNGTMNSGCAAATINGVPCNSTNVTIEPITPLPFGCTFNPNGNGKIIIPLGTNPFSTSIYYRFRSIANPAIFSETYRADFGINNRVTLGGGMISLSASNPVYTNTINLVNNSSIQDNSSGFCINGPASISNVTITETTTPTNPFWMITPNGNVVLRPGVSIGDTVPDLPQLNYELTYTMCMTGSSVWCNSGSVGIWYGYPLNKTGNVSNNLEKVVIAPNPSSDGIFNILFDTTIEKVTLEVYNNMGQKMYEEHADGKSEYLLAIDRLPKGTYILKLKDDNQTITKNIVKQ